VALTWRNNKAQRVAERIANGVNFCGKSAAGSP